MAKPILSLNDKRVLKIRYTHAALCMNMVSGEFRFFNVDNLPEKWLKWKFLKVIEARRSGFTISETIAQMNKELKRVKLRFVPKNKPKA